MIFRGNTRLFDKPEQELETSTGTTRLLTIDGINSYSDLSNKIVPVISYSDGKANATMNINNLGAKDIVYFGTYGIVNVVDDWTEAGQLYILYYDTDNDWFVMFNFIHPAAKSDICKVGSDILNLTNDSGVDDITNAFGSVSLETAFIEAITNGKIILLSKLNATTEYNNLVPIKYNSKVDDLTVVGETPNVTDTISILDLDNQQIKTLSFIRTTSTFTYTAVTVTTTPISGGSGGVTEEQVQNMIDESVGTINTELDNINGEVV